MKDFLVQGIANKGKVRIIVCNSTNMVKEAQQLHDLWSSSCIALGRTLSIGTLMSAMLKSEQEKIIIQINGGGAIGQIVAECYATGKARGYVSDPHVSLKYNDTNIDAVGMAVGKDGYLRVIRDISLKDDFTGAVALVSGEIGDDFAFYFTASEQIPTAVSVGVNLDENQQVKSAGAIIIQMMPGASDEDICEAEAALKRFPSVTALIEEGYNPKEIMLKYFPTAQVLLTRDIEFYCDCSKDRMQRALELIDKKDIKLMIKEDQGCEIGCNCCSKKYYFSKEELERFIEHGKMVH